MTAQAYEAVLFDFGGVLTTPVWDSFSAFCERQGLDREAIKNLFRSDPEALALLRGLETAEISEGEFETRFASKLGLRDPVGLIDRMFEGMKPLDAMVSAVRALRMAGITTALVSNSWGGGRYDRELLDSLFDAVVISGEIGLHKPQPTIYLRAAERSGTTPARCVFVDDLAENCEGAEAVGMIAIRHRDPGATIAKLTQLTAIEL